jgi:hypothetical protein
MEQKLNQEVYIEAIESIAKKYPEKIKKSNYKDFIWHLAIAGPENSVYKSGVFDIEIRFPTGHFGHPFVYFNTPIYHPNIGYFNTEPGKNPRPQADRLSLCYTHCLKFLEGENIVICTLGRVFSVLEYPDTICEHNGEVTDVAKNDKRLFYNTAKEWTYFFAHKAE